MKLALVQMNPTVGALSQNTAKILSGIVKAREHGLDLVIFPELALTGYFPKDLLLRNDFLSEVDACVKKIIAATDGIAVLFGFPERGENGLYNAALLAKDKKVIGVHHKQELPTYDVFDERRYFLPGDALSLFTLNDFGIGVTLCEDIWVEKPPLAQLVRKGAKVIVNVSASPFTLKKLDRRAKLLSSLSQDNRVPLVYCNVVGCSDDVLFDGHSCVYDAHGQMVVQAKGFAEDFVVVDLEKLTPCQHQQPAAAQLLSRSLIMGIKDYLQKNGFTDVAVGVSGGIDSAIVLALAVEALGKEHVHAVLMPGKYTPWKSLFDARKLCKQLDVSFSTYFIRGAAAKYEGLLSRLFRKTEHGITEQNLQARARGTLLMAVSNKFGWLVLATGNKSEIATGYCTLYGDTVGGVCVLGDVYKTQVYELAQYFNANSKIGQIPETILTKEPSAELIENQKDSDDLPPYAVLDQILLFYIEENLSFSEIVKKGFDAETVRKVLGLVDKNEFKRRQLPFCFKVSDTAFGSGRRMPITNGFRGG